MTTAAELREALCVWRPNDPQRNDAMLEAIVEAARERLAQLEGKALVIEKVNDAWPEWAVQAMKEAFYHWSEGPKAYLDFLAQAYMERLVSLPDRATP